MELDDRHFLSVLLPFRVSFVRDPARRRAPSRVEESLPVLRRWRNKRKVNELARLWAALEAVRAGTA
jgi:hypothetical protein